MILMHEEFNIQILYMISKVVLSIHLQKFTYPEDKIAVCNKKKATHKKLCAVESRFF